MSQRLQKVLAALGIASRRACERMIEEKRVKVNGQLAVLGCKVSPTDLITMDDKPVARQRDSQPHKVIIYNKPEGEVTTRHDPEGRVNVFRKLPKLKAQRWIAIGRLDIATTGLLLFTTNGELAHRLMHPSFEIKRKYAVRVLGKVTADIIRKLKKGVRLEDGKAQFMDLQDAGGTGANHWYHVTLVEGRNREVRRLWEAVGLTVSRLMRIEFAGIPLPRDLRSGEHRELTPRDAKSLYEQVGLEYPQDMPAVETKPRKNTKNKPRGARRSRGKH